jgi:hypothetical protein
MFILIGLVYLYVYGLLIRVVLPIVNSKADDTLIRFKSVAEGMDKLDDVQQWVDYMLSDMTRGEVVPGSIDDLVARSTNSRTITLYFNTDKPEKYKEAYKEARGGTASFDLKAKFKLDGDISEDLKMAIYDTLFPLSLKDDVDRKDVSQALGEFLNTTSIAVNRRRAVEAIKKEGLSSEDQTVLAAVTKRMKGLTKWLEERGWIDTTNTETLNKTMKDTMKATFVSQVSMTKDALFEEYMKYIEGTLKDRHNAQNFRTYGGVQYVVPQMILDVQAYERENILKLLLTQREDIVSRIRAREELLRTGGYTVWRRIGMIMVSILLLLLTAYSTVQVIMVFLAAVTRRPIFLSAYPQNRTVSWRYHKTGVILLFVVWLLIFLLPGIISKTHGVVVFTTCLIRLIRRDDMI